MYTLVHIPEYKVSINHFLKFGNDANFHIVIKKIKIFKFLVHAVHMHSCKLKFYKGIFIYSKVQFVPIESENFEAVFKIKRCAFKDILCPGPHTTGSISIIVKVINLI